MGIHFLLLDTVQIILTAGVGGIIILSYAAKDIFLKEESTSADGPNFANEYQELMWLAERQKRHFDVDETQRFFQLRQNWSKMHSYGLGP